MGLQLVQWDDQENKYKRGGAAPNFRAGTSSVGIGIASLAVTFGTALPNTSYAVIPVMMNTQDTYPQIQPVIVTAFTTSGFTVSWSAPTDSNNYKINWIVMQQG